MPVVPVEPEEVITILVDQLLVLQVLVAVVVEVVEEMKQENIQVVVKKVAQDLLVVIGMFQDLLLMPQVLDLFQEKQL